MMKKFAIICIIGLSFVFMTTEARKRKANNGENEINQQRNLTIQCLGQDVSTAKLTLGAAECTKEQEQVTLQDPREGRKHNRKPKQNRCVTLLCQRKKQGLLGESEGKFNQTGASGFIHDVFPETGIALIERGFLRCAEDYGQNGFSETDCKQFKRFEKCLSRAIRKVCDNGEGRKRRKQRKKNRKGSKGKNQGNEGNETGLSHVQQQPNMSNEESKE